MITVHIDDTTDGHDLCHCYDGVANNIILVNPSKSLVRKTLAENPNDMLLALGHGSEGGLFSATEWGFVIDGSMADLLSTRESALIWCHASDFARKTKGFKGFATSMFISNPDEALWFGKKDAVDEDVTHNENIFFSDRVCDLIKRNVPLNKWVDILREGYHTQFDFTVYNMNGLEYFDGAPDDGSHQNG